MLTLIYLQMVYVTDSMTEEEGEVYSWGCVLYYWGAKHTPSIRYHYEFHRLLLPAILHGSPMHIIGNLLVQVYYGFMLEMTHGIVRVSIVYIAGALGGSLFSCIWLPYNIAVGASAAIFGLISLEVVYFLTHVPVIDKKRYF
jgi:rhomboid protease GluP